MPLPSVKSAVQNVSFAVNSAVGVLSSELMTTVTIAINIAGGGLLVLPLAMHQASVTVGIALLAGCSVASIFTSDLLVLGMEMTGAGSLPEAFARVVVGPDTHATTEEEAAARLRTRRRLSTSMDLGVALYTLCMLVMYCKVITDICVEVAIAFEAGVQWRTPARYYAGFFFFFFFLTCMRRLGELAITTITGLLTIVFIAMVMVVEYSWWSYSHSGPVHRGVRWYEPTAAINLAVPALTVAVGYHYNAPMMYRELEDPTPRKWHRAASSATGLCFLLYVIVGCCGYFTFGPAVASAAAGGNIINNYDPNDRLMLAARIALAAHVACVFPVVAISVRDAFHRLKCRALGNHEEAENPDVMLEAHRSVIVVEAALVCSAAIFIAIRTPGIGFFVDVVGVLLGITLIFVVPAVMGLAINGGMWRNDEAAARRLEAVGMTVTPNARRELVSLAIAASGGMAVIVGLLVVLGLVHTDVPTTAA